MLNDLQYFQQTNEHKIEIGAFVRFLMEKLLQIGRLNRLID